MNAFNKAIDYLKKDTTYASALAPIELKIPFDLRPSDFLRSAKSDLDTNLEHSTSSVHLTSSLTIKLADSL